MIRKQLTLKVLPVLLACLVTQVPANASQSATLIKNYVGGIGSIPLCGAPQWIGDTDQELNVGGACFGLPEWATKIEIHIHDASGMPIPGLIHFFEPMQDSSEFCNDVVLENVVSRTLVISVGGVGPLGSCVPPLPASKGQIEVIATDQ